MRSNDRRMDNRRLRADRLFKAVEGVRLIPFDRYQRENLNRVAHRVRRHESHVALDDADAFESLLTTLALGRGASRGLTKLFERGATIALKQSYDVRVYRIDVHCAISAHLNVL